MGKTVCVLSVYLNGREVRSMDTDIAMRVGVICIELGVSILLIGLGVGIVLIGLTMYVENK